MNQDRYDLHTHTNFSDGIASPEELLHLVKEKGLKGLSITDHDTIEAYSDDLFDLANKLELTLLPGVEISSRMHSSDLHILGYGFDLKSESLSAFLKDVQRIRRERNLQMLDKFKELGIVILESELLELGRGNVVGRPHFASILVKRGYVKNFQLAFDYYLKDHGPAWVASPKHTPSEVVNEIHKAGGKAVIAHPFFIKKEKIVRDLLELRFDGIEGRYAKMYPSQEQKWIDIAKRKGWLVTGGSDYHGSIRPINELGSSWVGEDVISKLL